MPTTATYSHYFGFGMIDPRTLSNYLGFAATIDATTLTDDEDGTDDGFVALNDSVSWSATGSPSVTLIGVTNAGYPVLEDNGFYYILTDRGDLLNSRLVINETGYTMCFAAGTLIGTACGEREVENLQIGDLVLTSDGREVPVKWIGRQTLSKLLHREKAQLVRIKAGALGYGLPHSDLSVTGDHGMILDGLVINASALVNGDTIDWVPPREIPSSATVYHVETEAHDIILANGSESETFLDIATRKTFDNYSEYLALYGVERIVPEMRLPRITTVRLLPRTIQQRLGHNDWIKRSA